MYLGLGFVRLQVMKASGVGAQSAEETPMTHRPEVEELVEAARAGDAAAWDALVDRYLPLVTAVLRRLHLSQADADDVNQTVWLRLVEHLDRLREPRALPGWLATTARNEGLRQIRRRTRDLPVDPGGAAFDTAEDSDPGEALVEELRSHALREAMLELSEKHRSLLLLLLADPPLSYDDISARLGIPKGSIGPTRARALDQLRSSRALRSWADDSPARHGGAFDVFLD